MPPTMPHHGEYAAVRLAWRKVEPAELAVVRH